MVLRLAAILIFHNAVPASWNPVPGSWLLHTAAVCASLLPARAAALRLARWLSGVTWAWG
jgi:hypothetical protein